MRKGALLATCAAAGASACAARAPLMARIALRTTDPLALVTVDGAPAGQAGDYAKRRLTVRPGHHRLEVRGADGSVAVRETDLGPGDQVAFDLGGLK